MMDNCILLYLRNKIFEDIVKIFNIEKREKHFKTRSKHLLTNNIEFFLRSARRV